tara:strand:- start:3256 stop:3948 length:693 start_codon:yes stop_codon:yes gene_type:complete
MRVIMSGKKIDELDAYKIYVAMKSHFQGEYDYKKFNGKTRVNRDSFNKRKDQETFTELSRRFDKKSLEEYLLATFLNITTNGNLALARNEFMWTGNLLDEETFSAFKDWKKRVQSISYIFSEDTKKLLEATIFNELTFNESLKSINSEYPLIMQLENRGDISLETLIIYDKIFNFLERVKINDTVYWPLYKTKCKKYSTFLDININYYTKKIKEIMISDFYDDFGKDLER